jgi:alcohol dehydrogenase (cytochrome c)
MKSVAVAALIFLAALPAKAQSFDELKNDGRNTDNVLTYGMGYHQNRYSTLKQIDRQTVKRLVPVWNVSLGKRQA